MLGNLGKLTAPCSQMPILASNICELQGRGSSADHHRGERAVSRSAQLAACLRRVEALELPAMVRRIRWRLMNDCLALKSLCPRRASQAKSRPGVNQGPGAGSAASAPRGRRFNFADAFSSHDIKSSRAQHILFAVILFAVAMHRGLRLLAARNISEDVESCRCWSTLGGGTLQQQSAQNRGLATAWRPMVCRTSTSEFALRNLVCGTELVGQASRFPPSTSARLGVAIHKVSWC